MSLFTDYVNRDNGHERKIGRYWASDIYSIRKGYLIPENFFERKEIDEQGAKNIISGIADEAMLEEILNTLNIDHFYNIPKEIEIKDVVLVVKPDFVFDHCVIETKAPMRITTDIPEKWKDQLCAETKAFGLPAYLGIFRNNYFRRFSITLYKYEFEEKRWESIMRLLKEFHKKLTLLYPNATTQGEYPLE